MRIAMWSGPRNLSTAMMYAFAARGDCAVWDEPFYAPYLAATGIGHPMAAEVMAAHETDAAAVARACALPPPGGAAHFYMKQMAHHMLPGFPLGWAGACRHAHLIRHPARVIASYAAKRAEISLADIGFEEQHAIWRRLPGPVIDSETVRADPEAALGALCEALGLSFTPRMLTWPEGGHPADGVWARHWYGAVHRSRGFAGPEGPMPEVRREHRGLLDAALPVYEEMRAEALTL